MAEARYDGKPMLRLLDSWVLWAIAELDEETAAELEAMTPSLWRAFGIQGGTWQSIVEAKLELGESDVAWVRGQWAKQTAHDVDMGQQHNPVFWSRAVSDMISGHQGASE